MLSGKKKKILRISMLLLIFTGAFVQYQTRAPKRNFSDFHVPYTVGGKLLDGEEIYSYKRGCLILNIHHFMPILWFHYLACQKEQQQVSGIY